MVVVGVRNPNVILVLFCCNIHSKVAFFVILIVKSCVPLKILEILMHHCLTECYTQNSSIRLIDCGM